jgi:tripartite-type tricarboxylate transporter receptor subunit TctC
MATILVTKSLEHWTSAFPVFLLSGQDDHDRRRTVAGDLYDLYARAFAQFMGKHIPGQPSIIVQNMPGAGHMIAANYVYGVAKPDGFDGGERRSPMPLA